MPDVFTFDDDFQDSILAHFIEKPQFFTCYGEVLLPSYFQGAQATIVAKVVFNYLKKYSKVPTWNTLRQMALEQNKSLGIVDDREIVTYVDKLKDIETSDPEYVSEKVVAFAKERAVIGAIKKAIEDIKEHKQTEGGLVKLFEDAVSVGQNLDDMGYIYHEDYQKVLDLITKSDYGTPTGFRQWDRIWRRGWGPGWLVVLLAPPKRYKTVTCLNIALNMIGPAIAGDVLYYPCEITQELAFARAMTNTAQMGMDVIYDSPEMFKNAFEGSLRTTVAGNLIVKGFAAGEATILTIRNHARTVINQYKLKVKAIIIDYADTVRPSGTFEKEHLAQKAIYTEARAVGAEFGCPVIMPDRCTKEATDLRVPNMKAFQGAFAKGGVVDVAIGLCATDDEYAENILRTFVFLNRHGPAFQHFRGKVDPALCTIDIGEEIPYEPEEDKKTEQKPRRRSRSPDDDEDLA